MPVQNATTIEGERVTLQSGAPEVTTGHSGLETQLPGQPTTVSGLDLATRGQDVANFIEDAVDREIFRIKSEDTPLMQLALLWKTVPVNSGVVQHYSVDEPRPMLTTAEATTGGDTQAVLKLEKRDKNIPQEYDTLIVRGVDGYNMEGTQKTAGYPLMLFVTGHNAEGYPIVRAVNGKKDDDGTGELKEMLDIPAGSKIVVLANACYETQERVPASSGKPTGRKVFLQKTIFNHIISDYFDSQEKHVDYEDSVIAEGLLADFKRKRNRTFWEGRASEFVVRGKSGDPQIIRTTEGVLWQFKKKYQHNGRWTYEEFIALMKMFYTGEDVPNTCIALCGKNFLENIQCIDFSKHPEVKFSQKYNSIGWSVTHIHTAFGDVEFKREPTLDTIGYSNSCALFGDHRIVRYKRTNDHSINEKVEGEEATRKGTIMWDGIALKGACSIFVDCEGEGSAVTGVTFVTHSGAEAPTSPKEGAVYYLLDDCPGIDAGAKKGEMWQYKSSKWTEYSGEVNAAS